jgi:prophage antirepressor-like protein
MSALERFDFGTHGVRVVMIDGEPWFVAVDVAAVLGYSATSAMTRTLDDDEKGVRSLHTPGGLQDMVVISEPGVFSAIMRSRIPEAREFKRWVTHDVLPSIRQSGTYVAAETPEMLMARALIQAQDIVERRDTQIRELTPRAEAWDEMASAEGDYSVGDASKVLVRAGVQTGPQRLFEQLASLGWVFRGHDRRWRAYASAVDAGYLTEKLSPPRRDRVTDELIAVPPQVRVTARGLERLRVRLGVLKAVSA